MRFLLDEDLNPAVAEIGRRLELDVVSVHEIDRRGFTDEEQLRFSIRESRIFVTRNRDDFPLDLPSSPPPRPLWYLCHSCPFEEVLR